LIGATQTTPGLKVVCVRDGTRYELAKKVSDEEFASIHLKKLLHLKVRTTEFYLNKMFKLLLN
jgi:hypothetical protein